MPSAVVSRRQIIRACKTKGWAIQPQALAGLERVMQREEHASLQFVLEKWVEPHMNSGQTVLTNDIWDTIMGLRQQENHDGLDGNDDDPNNSSFEIGNHKKPSNNNQQRMMLSSKQQPKQQQQHSHAHRRRTKVMTQQTPPHHDDGDWGDLRVVTAFHQPKLVYNTMRQQFRVEEKEWSLFGTAEEKVDMLAQRYALVHQRILRHPRFRPTSLSHLYGPTADRKGGEIQLQLTPMERLLGQRHGSRNKIRSILVLGMLKLYDERYYLEDSTGMVPVALHLAQVTDPNMVLFENSIYLVEGKWHDGTLLVDRVGPPLLETRTTSLTAIHQQVQHPMFARPTLSQKERNPMVILSDVTLDQPQTMQQLEGMFATYEAQRDIVPLFVLMGNFSSTPIARFKLQMLIQDELGSTIRKFPYLAKEAHFVLIPGPNDVPASAVLPWALPSLHLNGITNMHKSSNPTRLYWQGKEMVIFRTLPQQLVDRENGITLSSRSGRNNDKMEDDDDDSSVGSESKAAPKCSSRLVKAMMDQGHLVPGSAVCPIFWNYDHALRLYPLPTTLVVGLGSYGGLFDSPYEGCHVIVPGSLSEFGQYAIYRDKKDHPSNNHRRHNRRNEHDMDLDDDDEQHEESPVQLVRLKASLEDYE